MARGKMTFLKPAYLEILPNAFKFFTYFGFFYFQAQQRLAHSAWPSAWRGTMTIARSLLAPHTANRTRHSYQHKQAISVDIKVEHNNKPSAPTATHATTESLNGTTHERPPPPARRPCRAPRADCCTLARPWHFWRFKNPNKLTVCSLRTTPHPQQAECRSS